MTVQVCFVGDSLVNGMGDPECLGWAGRLCVAARRQGQFAQILNRGR